MPLQLKSQHNAPVAVISDDSLNHGDSIEFTITHEVKLRDNTSAWVKYGVSSAVAVNESTDVAVSRVTAHVEQQALVLAKRVYDAH